MDHPRIKDKMWITFGDPNYYPCDKEMRSELRRRIKDADASALKEVIEAEVADGYKITDMHQDVIADFLSDAAPNGFVFEIRTSPQGNSNYGYFILGSD